MDSLLLVGLNHRLAPVELREKVAFSSERISAALHEIVARLPPQDPQAAILSTCNRSEVYIWTSDARLASEQVISFLVEYASCNPQELSEKLYILDGEAAARHLMSVAAGLDSLVIGEDEILGQVKDAYQIAQSAGTCGPTLCALFQSAIHAGKRARSETEIGCLRRSVAAVVVTLAKEAFPTLSNRTALLIGAGKISALTARALVQAGLHFILVANRTYERAQKLAHTIGGRAVHFDALSDSLIQADIAICSTGAPHIVLRYETIQQAMSVRKGRPLLIVDLAVPRDVDPMIAGLPQVTLVDIDDLEKLVQRDYPLANSTRQRIEDIISEEFAQFSEWLSQRRNAELIQRIQKHAQNICEAQIRKTLRRAGDFNTKQIQAIQTLAHAITSQLLHRPIQWIKSTHDDLSDEEVESLVRDFYGLN